MSYSVTGAINGGNQMNGYPGLAAGTTTTITTANAFPYTVDGQAYSKAALTNSATPTTDLVTGVAFRPLAVDTVKGNACVFVFCVNAAGTVGVVQGPIVKNQDITTISPAPIPAIPDTYTAFGLLLAQAGTTLAGAWTFGSSNLSGVTGMTYTFKNIGFLPSRPISA